MQHIAIIGASGAIGSAFATHLSQRPEVKRIHAFSRSGMRFDSPRITSATLDLLDESTIEAAAHMASAVGPLDLVLVATGILQEGHIAPEKSMRDMTAEKLSHLYAINTIGPTLVMKHFLPHLHRDTRAVFAALSARVGSISDNRLGGWYGYRASKAALNMMIRTASIEVARRHKEAIIIGLHPGTVDSSLSRPFQSNVASEKLFTPAYAVERMMQVITQMTPGDSGKCLAYDGMEIAP